MPTTANQTTPPRAGMPRSGERSEAVVFWIAFGVSSLFVAVQIGFAITFVPVMLGLFQGAGLELPPMLALAQSLGPIGIFVALGVFDAIVYALCAWAARKYWVGLLFLPPAIYLASTFGLFIGLVGGSAAGRLAQ